MEPIKQPKSWFLTDAACQEYAALTTLEERSVFLYSYLKQVASDTMNQKGFVFKTAFFLADAVAGSSLPYAAYPAIINGAENPFVALLETLKKPYGDDAMYCVMMAILCGVVNARDMNEWIYEADMFENNTYRERLESMDRGFLPSSDTFMAEPQAFDIDEALRFAQTELMWMFRQAG